MISVMVPGKVKDQRELPNEIDKLEAPVLMLQKEYKESLS